MSRFKMLVLDVNGTLVDKSEGEISPAVEKALKSIKDRIQIVLCSGRQFSYVGSYLKQLELPEDSLHVLENGGRIVNAKGETIQFNPIPRTSLQVLNEILKDKGEILSLVEGKWLSGADFGDDEVGEVVAKFDANDTYLSCLTELEKHSDLFEINVGNDLSKGERVKILINAKGASKGAGIKFIQDSLNISKRETIGAGDMPLDIPIFENSSLRLAMGNAHIDLKRKADYILPTVEQDGVAYLIEEYLN